MKRQVAINLAIQALKHLIKEKSGEIGFLAKDESLAKIKEWMTAIGILVEMKGELDFEDEKKL